MSKVLNILIWVFSGIELDVVTFLLKLWEHSLIFINLVIGLNHCLLSLIVNHWVVHGTSLEEVLLGMGPVIVQVRRKGSIGVSVLRWWTSNVWGWVLSLLGWSRRILLVHLQVSPIIVHVGREGRIWVRIRGHGASDVWLRVLSQLDQLFARWWCGMHCVFGLGFGLSRIGGAWSSCGEGFLLRLGWSRAVGSRFDGSLRLLGCNRFVLGLDLWLWGSFGLGLRSFGINFLLRGCILSMWSLSFSLSLCFGCFSWSLWFIDGRNLRLWSRGCNIGLNLGSLILCCWYSFSFHGDIDLNWHRLSSGIFIIWSHLRLLDQRR